MTRILQTLSLQFQIPHHSSFSHQQTGKEQKDFDLVNNGIKHNLTFFLYIIKHHVMNIFFCYFNIRLSGRISGYPDIRYKKSARYPVSGQICIQRNPNKYRLEEPCRNIIP